MRLRPGLFLAFPLVMMTVLSLGVASSSFFQPKEELRETNFHFGVTLRRIDWGERAFSTYIEVNFKAFPYNLHDEPYNIWGAGVHVEQWIDGAEITMNSFKYGPPYNLRGNVTTTFHLRGPPEYYPFDRYRMNITFTLPSFGLINETNTWIGLQVQEGDFDWALEQVPPEAQYETYVPKFSTITYRMKEWGEEVSLSYNVILSRASTSTNLLIQVLSICFALVGSLPLIKPEKLEHRLTVCLSLFIFAVAFAFVIPAPTITRATVAETLIWILLSAAGGFSVLSVVEKALIEARPSLAVLRYFLEGMFIFGMINSLNQSLIWLIPWQSAREYPGASPLPGLVPSLSVNLLFGYAAVTFFFIFNLVRKNRSKISKRIRNIRIFRKQRIEQVGTS